MSKSDLFRRSHRHNPASRCRRTTRLLAVLTALALTATACGNGGDGPTGTGDEEIDLAAFCENVIAGEARFQQGPETDDQGNPTEEGLEEFRNEIQPHLTEIEQNTPEEIQSEIETVLSAVRTALDEGDTAALESLEFFEAESVMDEYVFDNCEIENKQEFVAVNYEYQGVPETLEAGQTGLRMENRGTEVHEAIVFRINDDVDTPIRELLDLPEEEAEASMEFRGAAFAGPGEAGSAVIDLDPGRYAFVCFIPVGTTSMQALFEEGGEEEGASPAAGASPAPTGTPTPTGTPAAAASPTPTATPTPAGSPGAGEGEGEEGPPAHFTQGMFVELTVS